MRFITDAVKSFSIDLLLCSNSRPFSLLIEKWALLLWGKIIRKLSLNIWDHISDKPEDYLKMQRGFVQEAMDVISQLDLNFEEQQFL